MRQTKEHKEAYDWSLSEDDKVIICNAKPVYNIFIHADNSATITPASEINSTDETN